MAQDAAAVPRAQASAELAMQAAPLLPGERITLSGRLDHPAWQRATPHRQFVEKAPVTASVPAHPTEVRVLYDQLALYVGVRSEDPDAAQIRAPLVRHDGVNRTQDFVVVYIDAIGARQSAQFFRVNAAGSMADGMHTAADDSEDFAPDFDWDAAAQRDAQGWSAVLRIPFASLRYASDAVGPWRVMVARRVPRQQFYLHTSVLIPRDAPSFIATLQPLQGVRLPEDHAFLAVRPSLTWRRSRQSGDGIATRRDQDLDASLDLKWRPLAELVVDATLNPDFSQVALDVPQLTGNTRFALAIDEKRPFFFESSDLLRSPTTALYTRSITEPRWGLRATWRGAQVAGTAFASDDRGGGLVLLPGAYGTGVAEQPASTALVARLRGDAGTLQWGGLVAARRYDAGIGHNLVAGADLGWQISEAWRLRAQWLQSDTTALPMATAAGLPRLARGPAQAGHRAYLKAWYQTPQREVDFWIDDSGQGFRNDTGFVVQNGTRIAGARWGQGWHGLGPFNDFWINLEGEAVRDRSTGRSVALDWFPNIWLTGAHNLEAWLQWHGHSAQRLAVDQPMLRERFWRGSVTFTPVPWVPLATLEARWGRLTDVQARRVRPGEWLMLSLTTRPLARLDLEPRHEVLRLHGAGGPDYREQASQLIARWHVDARTSVRAILQHKAQRRAAPGAADEHSTAGSVTWAWRASTGTVLYLGASREHQRAGASSRGTELFAKLQVDMGEARQRLGW